MPSITSLRVRDAIALCCACLATAAGAQDPLPVSASAPRVVVDAGPLAGTLDPATGVRVFRGIPYAAPPVGALRWRPPEPPAPWSDVRDATAFGADCPQPRGRGAGTSEDCLFLNVWTGAADPADAPRPVLVWLHGGGGVLGSGSGPTTDGTVLARKGLVVVTLNFRLGLLGNLAHPALRAESSRGASGNYALLDQVAALGWVRRNIARFGGDPARVTIAGQSSGARAVATLLVSPLARGLFHRAILQSGSGLDDAVQSRAEAEARGVRIAAMLGVAGEDARSADALRALGPDTLVATLTEARRLFVGPPAPSTVGPVVDGWALPERVDEAISRGAHARVPVLLGTNESEALPAVRETAQRSAAELRAAFRDWYADTGGVLARAYALHDTSDVREVLREVWGDARYGAPARALARLLAAGGGRVFRYHFTRTGLGDDGPVAAFHAAEVPFAFGRVPEPRAFGRSPGDSALAEAMSDYWVAFATRGDPNVDSGSRRLPRWPAYEAGRDEYLQLGSGIVARSGLRAARYDAQDALARRRGAVRP